jgi:hypothetical protein
MTDERRSAARLRKTLERLRSTNVNRVADVIVGVSKGKFTKATACVWLLNSPDGQELMEALGKKESAYD